jgi:transposase
MRYIGVDLHKTNFVVCFLSEENQSKLETFALTPQGLAAFKRRLRHEDHVAVETSPNTFYFYAQIKDRVSTIVVVDTYKFAVIAKSKKKTDRGDAQLLARFLKLGWLPTVPVPSEPIQQLRLLFQAREQLVGMRTQWKNMGHAALVRNGHAFGRAAFASVRSRERLAQIEGLSAADAQILALVLRQLADLERELTTLEAEIIRLGHGLAGVKRLLQIRGLNVLTAIGVLTEIGNIALFESSKQLVAYAGLAPSIRQSSGTERRGKITKQGRRRLRTMLVQAVLTLIRQPQTPLADFYARKKQEKGAGKAICAAARKLLTIIFVMLKKQLDYWYIEDRLYNQKLPDLQHAA